MGVSGQRHAPAALCPGERTPGTHYRNLYYFTKIGKKIIVHATTTTNNNNNNNNLTTCYKVCFSKYRRSKYMKTLLVILYGYET
jgi:hypothetical protein